VPLLPFLAAPVAAAWRASPTVALALALASIAVTSVALVAQPLATSTDAGTWFHRLEHGRVTQTAFHWAWGQGAAAQVLPVLALIATAVTLALLVTPGPRLDTRSLVLAAAALVTWRVLYTGAPTMLTVDRNSGGTTGLLAVLALVASISLLFVMLSRWVLIALVPALMLLPVGWPRFAAHTGFALPAVAVALAGLAIVALRNRHEPASL